MNVYELKYGNIRHFVVAKDEHDAYQQGTDPELFPDLHFRPFETHLVEVEGYTIKATADKSTKASEDADDAPKRGRRKAAS